MCTQYKRINEELGDGVTCSPDIPANQNEISLVAYMQVILVAKVSKAILGIALNSIAPHFSYVCGVRE